MAGLGQVARRWRRTCVVAATATCALGATAVVTAGPSAATVAGRAAPAQAVDERGPGVADAFAALIKVDPRASQLSIGVTLASSLANHRNTLATVESRAIDLGILGTTLSGPSCTGGDPTLSRDQLPQSLRATSTDEDAGTVRSEQEQFAPVLTEEVVAGQGPSGRATTTLLATGIPGVLEIRGGDATATTGLVADGVREARAVTTIGAIAVAPSALMPDGMVSLRGLRWEAVHRSGAEDLQTGTFTIEGIAIAGVDLPLPGTADLVAGLAQLNAVLEPLGLRIDAPAVDTGGAVTTVTPLSIGIVPGAVRDTATGAVLDALLPVRQQIANALTDADCRLSTANLVSDIALGAVSGSGSVSLQLGGVTATTRPSVTSNLLGGPGTRPGGALGAVPPAGGSTGGSATPARPGTPGSPGTPARPAPATTATTAAPAPVESAAPEATATPAVPALADGVGPRGGAMAAVSGLGLAALAAAAEADRRKMRRAQREIPGGF